MAGGARPWLAARAMSSIFEAFLSTAEVQDGLRRACPSWRPCCVSRPPWRGRRRTAGLIPESAAQSIIGTCKVELFDVAKIVRESPRSGSLAIPLVASLRETVGLFNPAAVAHVHRGCTSQDVDRHGDGPGDPRRACRLIETDVRPVRSGAAGVWREQPRPRAGAGAHADATGLGHQFRRPSASGGRHRWCAACSGCSQVAPRALQLQLGGTVRHAGQHERQGRAGDRAAWRA